LGQNTEGTENRDTPSNMATRGLGILAVFQVDGVETEKAHDEKLFVMPYGHYGLARRFVLK